MRYHYSKYLDLIAASLEGFPILPKLVTLDVSANKLSSLRGMPSLACLEELFLSNNRITDLSFIDKCPRINELDISSNGLTTQLKPLASLKSLTVCIVLLLFICDGTDFASFS